MTQCNAHEYNAHDPHDSNYSSSRCTAHAQGQPRCALALRCASHRIDFAIDRIAPSYTRVRALCVSSSGRMHESRFHVRVRTQ